MIDEINPIALRRAKTLHCEKIRRFYCKILGIWLPVHLPLFLRASTCRTFFKNQDNGRVMLTDRSRKFVVLKGYMTKNNTCPLLPFCA